MKKSLKTILITGTTLGAFALGYITNDASSSAYYKEQSAQYQEHISQLETQIIEQQIRYESEMIELKKQLLGGNLPEPNYRDGTAHEEQSTLKEQIDNKLLGFDSYIDSFKPDWWKEIDEGIRYVALSIHAIRPKKGFDRWHEFVAGLFGKEIVTEPDYNK